MNPSPFRPPTWRQRWQAFRAMATTELRIMSRYPVQFVTSFFQVFLIIGIFALAGLAFTPRHGAASTEMAGVVAYGFLVYLFFSDILWTIGYRVREEQIQGTLEQLYLTPASKIAALMARSVLIFTWSGLLGLTGIWLLRGLLGQMPVQHPGWALLALGLTLMGTFGVGLLFAGVTLRLKEAANTLVGFSQFVVIVLSAAFFPFRALPPFLWALARWFPISWGVDAFRSALMGFPPGYPELAPFAWEIKGLVLFALLMPLVGVGAYRWAERRARQTGALGEY